MSNFYFLSDYLEERGSLTYANVGTSMMPLLREGIDLFTVKKKGKERFKRGDVVLYHRTPDKYVLHRIIEVTDDDYVIMGDNTVSKEVGIKDDEILGIMIGYTRNGRYHSTDEIGYRLYTAYILRTIKLRVFLKRSLFLIKVLIQRVMNEKQ